MKSPRRLCLAALFGALAFLFAVQERPVFSQEKPSTSFRDAKGLLRKPVPVVPPQNATVELTASEKTGPIYELPSEQIRVPSLALALSASGGPKVDIRDAGHQVIGLDEAWKHVGAKTRGHKTRVAVIDSGIDPNHTDFKGRVEHKDFTSEGPQDHLGHGSHVAGIIAASENGAGVVGVAPEATLINAKVFNANRRTTQAAIVNAIRWAAGKGDNQGRADVLNLSFGGATQDPVIRAAITDAVNEGVIVVVASGNAWNGDPHRGRDPGTEWPGGYRECICVGAFIADDPRADPEADEEPHFRKRFSGFDENGKRRYDVAPFSNRSKFPPSIPDVDDSVDVSAPGWYVVSSYPGDQILEMSGTSMATPYVAGVAALYVSQMKAAGKVPTPNDFRERLRKSSEVTSQNKPNIHTGWGRLRADLLVKDIESKPVEGGGGIVPAPPGTSVLTNAAAKSGEVKSATIEYDGGRVKSIKLEYEGGAAPLNLQTLPAVRPAAAVAPADAPMTRKIPS